MNFSRVCINVCAYLQIGQRLELRKLCDAIEAHIEVDDVSLFEHLFRAACQIQRRDVKIANTLRKEFSQTVIRHNSIMKKYYAFEVSYLLI